MTLKTVLLAATLAASGSSVLADGYNHGDPIDRFACLSERADGTVAARFTTSQVIVDENLKTVPPYNQYTFAEDYNAYEVDKDFMLQQQESNDRHIERMQDLYDREGHVIPNKPTYESFLEHRAILAEQNGEYSKALQAIEEFEQSRINELLCQQPLV